VEAVELRSVTADEAHCSIDRDQLVASKGKKLNAVSNLNSEVPSRIGSELSCKFRLEIALRDVAKTDDNDAQPIVIVGLVYRATYDLAREVRTTKVLLEAFRDRVSLMHVLPFMRAHVVDLTARAGLAPLLLPLMKRRGVDHVRSQPSEEKGHS